MQSRKPAWRMCPGLCKTEPDTEQEGQAGAGRRVCWPGLLWSLEQRCRVLGVMFGSFTCPERDDQQENASDLAGLLVLEIAVRSFSGSSQQLPQVLTCTHTPVCTHV